jgi:spore coat protein CotH
LYHTDIAAVVNEMAGQALMLHQDRCTKNYYMHHDIATGLWRRIPW